jgi:hypothetical protein
MNQNASLPMSPGTPGRRAEGADESIVARTAQRSLARRQAVYADEVRRFLDAGLEVMRECGTWR